MKKGFLLSLSMLILGGVLVSLAALFSHDYMDDVITEDSLFMNANEKFESIENVFQQIFDNSYGGDVYSDGYVYAEEDLPFNSNADFRNSVDDFIDFVKENEDVDFEVLDDYSLIGYGDVSYKHGNYDSYDALEILGGNSLNVFVNAYNASVQSIDFNGQSGNFRLNVSAVGLNGTYFNEEELIDINSNLVVNINLDDGSKVVVRSFNNEELIRIWSESNKVKIGSLFYDDVRFSFVKVKMNFSEFNYYLDRTAEVR